MVTSGLALRMRRGMVSDGVCAQVSRATGPRVYRASPSTVVMTNPRPRTFARKDVAASEYSRLGAAGARAVESPEFAHLTGSLRDKCRNEALRESVRQELKWAKPPTGSFLYEEVQTHHERAKAPEQEKPKRRPPKKRGPPSPSPPPPPKRATPTPAPAKPLASQDLNQGESGGATVAAPSQLTQLRDRLDHKDRELVKVITRHENEIEEMKTRHEDALEEMELKLEEQEHDHER